MLRATDVSFGFGDDLVLQDLSVTVAAGEVLAVIGPSGVGKTTLLRLLALHTEPDAGTVSVDGADAWAVDDDERLTLRRRIAMVFQGASLFDATVRRNVEYGLRIRRSWQDRLVESLRWPLGPSDASDEVLEALDVVGLADVVDQRAESLSGGEAQRVSFARALAFEPDLLLLDEPTSDLDPRNTAVIEDAIAAACDRGIGIVVATHDMHQAERVADRVAVLLGRNFTEVGPTETVFDRPTDERTRQFISGELVYSEA